MAEYESRAAMNFKSQVEGVLRRPETDEELFKSLGEVTVGAILRKDLSTLEKLYEESIKNRINDTAIPTDERLRLKGSLWLVAGGAVKIRQSRGQPPVVYENQMSRMQRHTKSEKLLGDATDMFLATGEGNALYNLTLYASEAIFSADRSGLEIAGHQLNRLASQNNYPETRLQAMGMLDIVRPALDKTHILRAAL